MNNYRQTQSKGIGGEYKILHFKENLKDIKKISMRLKLVNSPHSPHCTKIEKIFQLINPFPLLIVPSSG